VEFLIQLTTNTKELMVSITLSGKGQMPCVFIGAAYTTTSPKHNKQADQVAGKIPHLLWWPWRTPHHAAISG
jgi:hypothetical protein